MDNRTKILSCALQLFSTRGYEAVGVREIVEAAGLSKPTLYHYFGSKHGLLEDLVKNLILKLHKDLKNAAIYNNDLPLTLTKIVIAFFNFAQENNSFYRMHLSMLFSPPESDSFKVVSKFQEMLFEVLTEMFTKAADNYGNMKGRHLAFATTLQGMINAYIRLYLNGSLELDDELVHKVVHQFQHGIYT